MSGLAAILAGQEQPGIYHWHGAFDVDHVAHVVDHAGWAFAHVDGWRDAATKTDFLAAVGRALQFPDHYGHNLDALADCLRDTGRDGRGVVLLWDGWSTLARADAHAFDVVLSVLRERVESATGASFAVLLRGDGPEVAGVTSLD